MRKYDSKDRAKPVYTGYELASKSPRRVDALKKTDVSTELMAAEDERTASKVQLVSMPTSSV